MNEEPVVHRRRSLAREREQRAGVRVHRPVPVLVLCLERGTDHAGGRVVHDDAVGAVRRELRDDARLRDLAAHEDRLAPGRAHGLRRLLGGGVVPHVAEHDAPRAVADEPERDRQPDPPCAAGDQHRRAGEAHRACGSGSSAGAELGSSSQPGRERGSRPPSCAFEDA